MERQRRIDRLLRIDRAACRIGRSVRIGGDLDRRQPDRPQHRPAQRDQASAAIARRTGATTLLELGTPVLAPAAGTVTFVLDGRPDVPIGSTDMTGVYSDLGGTGSVIAVEIDSTACFRGSGATSVEAVFA